MSLDEYVAKLRAIDAEYRGIPSLKKAIEKHEEFLRATYSKVDERAFNLARHKNYINSHQLHELIRQKTEGDMIIFVENANNYILFKDLDEYQRFLLMSEDDDLVKYQIVFSDERQKFLFGYHDADDKLSIDKLSNYIIDCFDKEPLVQYNAERKKYEIMIDIILNKYSDGVDYFEKLYGYVLKMDAELADKLRLPTRIAEPITDQRYILHQLAEKSINMEEILRQVATIPRGGSMVIAQNVIINIGGNVNVEAPSKRKDRENITREWVAECSPDDLTLKSEYYNKYSQYMKDQKLVPLAIQKFTKLVEGSGFKECRVGSARGWRKG